MSETSSAARRPASAAGSAKDERLRFRFVVGGIVLALALAVVMLRLHRLSELPPGIYGDEGAHGVDALRALRGEHAVFFPGNYGREGLIVYAVASAISVLGRTALALRLPTALASAGTVFVVFWLGYLLFGRDEESGRATPWRGLLVGGVGAGLLAVSIGQTVLGRTAFRANFLPLLLSLCLALLWWGWRQRFRCRGSWWRVALAGACAGLLPYTYTPARFTPFLFLFFGLSFVLLRGRGEDGGESSKRDSLSPRFSRLTSRLRAGPLKRYLPWIGIFLGVAGLVAAPILIHFALHHDHFFSRSGQLSVFQPGRSLADSLAAFLGNVLEHLLAFGFHGDPNWRHNFAGQPMLNLGEAFFFWLGVSMAVWRWQRPAYRLLLLWLGLLLLPAMLSRDAFVPHFLRMIGAAPAIYLLIGVGVWEVFRLLRERCRANRIFQNDEIKAAIVVAALISVSVLVQGVSTYRTYFQQWAAAPELDEAYGVPWVDLTQALNAQPSNADMAYLIPNFHSDYSFEYLYQGAAPAHLFHPAMPDLAQKIESALAAMENVSTVKVVEWKANAAWVGDDTGRFAILLSKYGRYLNSDEYPDFQIHTYTDISLERPWTFYEQLEPLTVDYDGGIALRGLALGQGAEQLSSRQLLNLEQDRPLWMALQWQTAPGMDIDYAISLRLYNAEGERAYQEDAVLWDPTHMPTSHWSADEQVDTLSLLSFPAELQAGEYELRLVVYNFETQVPTVQVGVWEPEVTLARLRLAEIK